jgi:hypothetical protein
MQPAAPRPEHPAIVEAKLELSRLGISFWQPSSTQIKVGIFNFYPTTGKITKDGGPKISEQGLAAFIALVRPKKSFPAPLPANNIQSARRPFHGRVSNIDPEDYQKRRALVKSFIDMGPQPTTITSTTESEETNSDPIIEIFEPPPWDE